MLKVYLGQKEGIQFVKNESIKVDVEMVVPHVQFK